MEIAGNKEGCEKPFAAFRILVLLIPFIPSILPASSG